MHCIIKGVKLKLRTIIKDLYADQAYGVWFIDYRGRESFIAQPIKLIFENNPESHMFPEPTLRLPYEYAQELLQSLCNALIEQGIRPNTDKASGEIEATKLHLKSLQETLNRTIGLLESKL